MEHGVQRLAAALRAHTLRMVHRAGAGHVGTCLSMADLLAVLYGSVLRLDPARPGWQGRDRFLLSKGHGAAILYAALAERGFFPAAWLEDYYQQGSPLLGHVSHGVPGVELSTGALGHALPVACGMAIAAQRARAPHRVFVLLGDGELDEGSNWEAIMFAGHHRLDRLVAIVDSNGLQSFGHTADVLDLEPLAAKWEAFGWAARTVDGHAHAALEEALAAAPWEDGRPSVLIAPTVKGKGVSFMEGQLAWHYKTPDAAQLAMAMRELGVPA